MLQTEAVQILGGYGYTKDFPVERYYRDAKFVLLERVHQKFRN